LGAAEVALGYATIRAPISGTIASVSTRQGETVAAAFAAPTFVTIVARRALELEAMVDETDIGRVAVGDRAHFSVESFPDRTLAAVVRRIDPTPTVISGVVNYAVIASIVGRGTPRGGAAPPAYARPGRGPRSPGAARPAHVDGAPRILRPGMTADIVITTGVRRALMVPDAAVQRVGDGVFATVWRGGHAVRARVSVGRRTQSWIEITAGLAAGERVAIGGAQR
jgi:multidrug efflux pump subunit AcrA (membrane-fusion protein)